MLPMDVLQQVKDELFEWQDEHASVMEVSHRSPAFMALLEKLEADTRALLSVPSNYKILFMTAPARLQFSMIPFNIMGENEQADYIKTGVWSEAAIKEGQRYLNVNTIASGESSSYQHIPHANTWQHSTNPAYLHYTDNESVNGVQFHSVPNVGDTVIVSDMTSSLFTRPIDVSRFGIIYAGCQKNLSPAGLSVVIIRDDLLDRAHPLTPTTCHYKTLAEHSSLLYTPATFTYYVASIAVNWLASQGGLAGIGQKNAKNASLLYAYLDGAEHYHNPVDPACRSTLNIPFFLSNPSLDTLFIEEAKAAGLIGLQGHRLLGGMRASLYNAMPIAGVKALISFMSDFSQRHCERLASHHHDE